MPPYSHQADVWVELLKHFNYKKVIFIHSSDTDGRALLGRFQTTSQSLEDDIEIKVQVCHNYKHIKLTPLCHLCNISTDLIRLCFKGYCFISKVINYLFTINCGKST